MILAEAKRIEDVTSKTLSRNRMITHFKNKIPQKMVEFCRAHNGVGLAAPQLGLFDSFFVARMDGIWIVFFNPELIMLSPETISTEESCLSYPGMTVKVVRMAEVKVRFSDGNRILIKKYSGLNSTVFQHEYDHLRGITIKTLVDSGEAELVKDPKGHPTI